MGLITDLHIVIQRKMYTTNGHAPKPIDQEHCSVYLVKGLRKVEIWEEDSSRGFAHYSCSEVFPAAARFADKIAKFLDLKVVIKGG